MKLLCALLTALLSQHAAAAAFDCFTVIDPRGDVVYKSNRSPIDLSRRISEAMAADYPGHHLIWSRTDDACTAVDRLPARGTAQANGSATLERPKLVADAEDLGKRTARSNRGGSGRAR